MSSTYGAYSASVVTSVMPAATAAPPGSVLRFKAGPHRAIENILDCPQLEDGRDHGTQNSDDPAQDEGAGGV